ncbi:hypothetical protein ZIOFF_069501 [Zingiber officinale]|uniref:PUM-HD domain-containing protein n=1 Tax=Zingiber officinale TaxID=94328 RepID=A0A8J5CVY5_ZINOF|nr:hypothetical protein ZIOFF_069501 [Zingiber officinale]
MAGFLSATKPHKCPSRVPEVHLGTSMRKLNSSSSIDNSIGGTSFIHVDNVATVILILLLYSSIWLSVLEHCDNPNTQQRLSWAMMKDQFGNYVVQKVLETCDDQQQELILSRIKVALNALKKYTYGKHIVARVEKLVAAGGEEEDQAPDVLSLVGRRHTDEVVQLT